MKTQRRLRGPYSAPASKTLAGLCAMLCLSGSCGLGVVDMPISRAVNGPQSIPGGGLLGEYWQRAANSIAIDGTGNPLNRIDVQINRFGPPTGVFIATQFI